MPRRVSTTIRSLADGRAHVIDGLFTAAETVALAESIDGLSFERKQTSTFAAPKAAFWVAHLRPTEARKTGYYDRLVAAIRGVRPGARLHLYTAYINSNSFGDMLYAHRDSRRPGDITALLFANPKWKPEWGGELLFFDDRHDAIACVSPRPGRVAIFTGDLLHSGTPPTRVCYAPRLTFVFKFTEARRR
jgi:SM-20-related protein